MTMTLKNEQTNRYLAHGNANVSINKNSWYSYWSYGKGSLYYDDYPWNGTNMRYLTGTWSLSTTVSTVKLYVATDVYQFSWDPQ